MVVPGMANDLAGYGENLGLRTKVSRLCDAAAVLGGDVATIAWLGYDTPDGADAGLPGAAVAGAGPLQRFLEGVDPESEKLITVIAHSYGSVLAGIAARGGLEVDNLVFLGSPGTTLEHASDASLRGGAPGPDGSG